MIWIIVSSILFFISIFIAKHTYDETTKTKIKFPLWLFILMIMVYMIPVINIIVFIIGLGVYCIELVEYSIYFEYKATWFKNFIKFITQDIN